MSGAIKMGTYSASKATPKVHTVAKKMMTQIRNGHREYLFKGEDVKDVAKHLGVHEVMKAVDKYDSYEISLASNREVNEYFIQWAEENNLPIKNITTIKKFIMEEKILWV
jgi:hypothetical protein